MGRQLEIFSANADHRRHFGQGHCERSADVRDLGRDNPARQSMTASRQIEVN